MKAIWIFKISFFHLLKIIDGNIMQENLHEAELNEDWLNTQLRLKGLDKANVFYAGLDTEGNLYVSPKNKTGEWGGKYGLE